MRREGAAGAQRQQSGPAVEGSADASHFAHYMDEGAGIQLCVECIAGGAACRVRAPRVAHARLHNPRLTPEPIRRSPASVLTVALGFIFVVVALHILGKFLPK